MSAYPAYTFEAALAVGARWFFAALRQAAVLDREHQRAAVIAASYPYLRPAQQRQVMAALGDGVEDDTDGEDVNEQYLRNLREIAAHQGGRREAAPVPESRDHTFIRSTIARLRAPGEAR